MIEVVTIENGCLLEEAEKTYNSYSRKIFVNYAWLVQVQRKHMEVFNLFHRVYKMLDTMYRSLS